MGWTGIHANYYRNGKIDRKKECDAYFTEDDWCEVIKSRMVGATYYAAVRINKSGDGKEKPENERKIVGVVILTSVDMSDYFNFNYKVMTENDGPAYYECPRSILKVLSPTDDNWALNWRNKCEEFVSKTEKLHKLPYGAEIMVLGNKYVKTTIKGRAKWVDWKNYKYLNPKDIVVYGYEEVLS